MTKLRSISATILTAILLMVTCMSARCEVMCDLGTAHANCESAKKANSAESKQDSMSGMRDCGMKTQSAHQPEDAEILSVHSQCQHRVCTQPAAVVPNENAWQLPLSTLQAVIVVAVFSLHHADLSVPPVAVEDRPPLRSISPLELSTLLRI